MFSTLFDISNIINTARKHIPPKKYVYAYAGAVYRLQLLYFFPVSCTSFYSTEYFCLTYKYLKFIIFFN